MVVRSNFKVLLAIALMSFLGLISGVAMANATENSIGNNSLAPEATSSEAAGSFRDIPSLKKAFIDGAPADQNDALAVGELGVDGGNKDMIMELAGEISEGKHGRFDSLLVAHKGKLLFESYYLRGRINLPHPQASATKSYTGMAVGRAIQLGYLTMADLDKPIASFLKGLKPEKFARGAETVTLHNAMAMHSGVGFSDEQMGKFRNQPEQFKGLGQVQAYLELSAPITTETQSFNYQSPNPIMVMQVLDAVVPGSAKDFIKNELLDKIGIDNFVWRDNSSGLPIADSRSSMTSRNMVKWGALAMNKGKWKGEQLIPEAFIAKATNRVVRVSDEDAFFSGKDISDPGYGYYWWQADMKVGDKRYFSTSAQGGGGQYIIVIDELDLVVVATAHDSRASTMQITAERVLPAFISGIRE